ncbi:MAG: HD domain-containing protein [Alloprevotella sp.]|nr:HD domain-containing protein [Alloprevotella sp.]
MTPEQINENKQIYLDICRKHIQREGLEDLLNYLDKETDFFTAPSSSKFHMNEVGGLCHHSLNVFNTAVRVHQQILDIATNSEFIEKLEKISLENIAVATLFHDLCKTNIYKVTEKWKKDNDNRWVSYSGYEVKDDLPFGHGEKSCFIVHRFMKLYKDELLAIRWHMGMFDLGENASPSRIAFYNALDQSPLTAIVHAADFLSTNCLEPTTKP